LKIVVCYHDKVLDLKVSREICFSALLLSPVSFSSFSDHFHLNLLSLRLVDPIFGLSTGVLAYYIWETDAKNAHLRPEGQKLHDLLRRKFVGNPSTSTWNILSI